MELLHASTDKKVLIVHMPLATPDFPGLGPTLIRSILIRDGIPCDILYGNLVFSRLINGDPFVERQLAKLATSEILFSPYYFDTTRAEVAEYLRRYVSSLVADASGMTLERFLRLVDFAGACVTEIFEQTRWEDYDIVGFSTMMQQTVASLALAKCIKTRHPSISIIFGGPNVASPMGDEAMRCFREIDYVADGEADAIISPLVRSIREDRGKPCQVSGVLYRDPEGKPSRTGPGIPFNDLNSLPIPDYGPFFEQLEWHGITHVQPYLQLETTRGCWWGEKQHCTFCGIDDNILKYRTKSEEVVLDEILKISARYGYVDIFVVDSIINYQFHKTLLPAVGRLREDPGFDFSFFFESKSNIKREQVQSFHNAGINSVQPGLESFSDHILSLMHKGTTGVRQVQCLKLLAECDIVANWNLIFQLPGETPDDYAEQVQIIPFLHHLPPLHSEGLIPMLLNRYAPYHNTPWKFGIRNVRPLPWYKHVFPHPDLDLNQFAFYFDYDHDFKQNLALKERYAELKAAIDEWRACWRANSLLQRRGPGFLEIEDRRIVRRRDGTLDQERHRIITLTGVHAEIFASCDEMTTESGIVNAFSDRLPADAIRAFLIKLHAERLVYRAQSGSIINLPLLKEPIVSTIAA